MDVGAAAQRVNNFWTEKKRSGRTGFKQEAPPTGPGATGAVYVLREIDADVSSSSPALGVVTQDIDAKPGFSLDPAER